VWWAMEEVKVPTPHGRNSTRDKEEEEIKKGGKCILTLETHNSTMRMFFVFFFYLDLMLIIPPLLHSVMQSYTALHNSMTQ